MLTYIVRRIFLIPPTLIGMTAIVFFVMAMAPGGIGASLLSRTGEMRPEERKVREDYLNRRYGLDRPKYVQYLHWLNKVSPIGLSTYNLDDPKVAAATAEQNKQREPVDNKLAELRREQAQLTLKTATDPKAAQRFDEIQRQINQLEEQRKTIRVAPQAGDVKLTSPRIKGFDLGDSFVRGRPVNSLVSEALPVTIMLQSIAVPLGYAMAIWLGIQQARRRGSTFDFTASGISLALWSIPQIWVGVLLIGFLANNEYLHWFPTTGLNNLNETAMAFLPTAPALARYLGFAAYVVFHAVTVLSLTVMLIALVGLLISVAHRSFDSVTIVVDLIVATLAVFVASLVFVGRLQLAPAVMALLLLAVAAMAVISRMRYEKFRRQIEQAPLAARWVSYFCGIGALLILSRLVGVKLPDGPPGIEGGWLMDRLYHIVLPVVCLTYANFAFLSRLTRGALLDNLYADFVRTARAKGLSERVVLYRHAFRNSLIPLITVVVNLLPLMIAGSVVVENIFSVNGMGKLFVDAAFQRDFELLLSIALVGGVLDLTAFLLADIGFVIADPRVSYG